MSPVIGASRKGAADFSFTDGPGELPDDRGILILPLIRAYGGGDIVWHKETPTKPLEQKCVCTYCTPPVEFISPDKLRRHLKKVHGLG